MDFKIMLTTFGMVFLAELGDKTQLATFSLSAVLSSLIAVLFGAAFSRFVPAHYIKIGAGLFFIVVVISSALAAFICGCFWEMWNYYSLAKWVYSVSFVHSFQIFEMPILGYAGYLPFGLECAVIGAIMKKGAKPF